MNKANTPENLAHAEISTGAEGNLGEQSHEITIPEGEARLDQNVNQRDTDNTNSDTNGPGKVVSDIGEPASLPVSKPTPTTPFSTASVQSFETMINAVKDVKKAATGRLFNFGLRSRLGDQDKAA